MRENKYCLHLKLRTTSKTYESKYYELQSDKNNFERQLLTDEAKSKEIIQHNNQLQVKKMKKKSKLTNK